MHYPPSRKKMRYFFVVRSMTRHTWVQPNINVAHSFPRAHYNGACLPSDRVDHTGVQTAVVPGLRGGKDVPIGRENHNGVRASRHILKHIVPCAVSGGGGGNDGGIEAQLHGGVGQPCLPVIL